MRHTLKEIQKNIHKPVPYWFRLIMIFSTRITWFLANFTKRITPNIVTIISLFSFLIGALFYYKSMFVIGALFVFFRDILDDVDGLLARTTNRTSKLGQILDCFSNYIGTGACMIALFLSGDVKLIMLIMPFTILALLLFTIQASFLYLFVNHYRKQNYSSFLDYSDARTITILIIPLFYFALKNLQISYYNILIAMFILICIRQILWIKYYYKDIKNSFNEKNNDENTYNLSKGFF